MLLHGGNGSRKDWHAGGYITRLQREFTVIAVDLRGHGESDKPTNAAFYTTEKMEQDLLAVADTCNIERFLLCGFSFGGNVGRYLAAHSDRVSKMVMLGNRMSGASVEHRQFVFDFRNRWEPAVKAAKGGIFDPKSLSPKDQEDIQELIFPGEFLPSVLAWTLAMLDWDTVTPADLRCPTLWLIGSENDKTLESYKQHEAEIPKSNVQVRMLEGLNHAQEFENIELVLPIILNFIRSKTNV